MILIYILYALFILAVAINLFCSLKEYKKARDISKLFILPIILAICILKQPIDYFLFIALLFAYVGDIILNLHSKHSLIIGGTSFLLANVFFAIAKAMKVYDSHLDLFFLLISIIVPSFLYILSIALTYKKSNNNMKLFVPIYLFFNCLVFSTSMMDSFVSHTIFYGLGGFLYLVSDFLLIYGRLQPSATKITRYFVMPFYSLGIFLLCVVL